MGRLRAVNERKCSLENCNRRHYAKGLCKQHYWPAWKESQKSDAASSLREDSHAEKQLPIV